MPSGLYKRLKKQGHGDNVYISPKGGVKDEGPIGPTSHFNWMGDREIDSWKRYLENPQEEIQNMLKKIE